MYYEINVSRNGTHYFATAKRSLTDKHIAVEMFKLFEIKFPESDGYRLMLTEWRESGKTLMSNNSKYREYFEIES